MSSEEEQAAQLVYPTHVQHNTNSLYTIRFLSSSFVGAVAGVLGLENFQGFALFAFSTLLTAASIWLLRCQGKPQKYIHGGLWSIINPGQENLFSFVLFWTLFYGMEELFSLWLLPVV
ncbi:hypothetical protein FRC03_005990 [Tulasnella sp. 419]|nr:hypothetical protein FRC03_005990 [Tulasnella sp. 419]